MSSNTDRVPPSFFEADDEGYWQATDEAGEDGNATGIEFVQYVDPPDQQIQTYQAAMDSGFEFTDAEVDAFPEWFEQQYPDIYVINDGSDLLSVAMSGDYLDGEGTQDLYDRMVREHPSWNIIHNRWCTYYHGLEDYIVHCKVQRHQKEEA